MIGATTSGSTKSMESKKPTPPLTALDENKKRASEYLHLADQLVRSKEFGKALLAVRRAQEFDSLNAYASAMQERVNSLIRAGEAKPVQEVAPVVAQEPPVVPVAPFAAEKISPQCSAHTPPPAIQASVRVETVQPPVVTAAPMQKSSGPTIVLIDDDSHLLEAMAQLMKMNGLNVAAVSTSDEAFQLLRTLTPDIILCDINLETSTMGGFSFFEKVQELAHLRPVPFLFLTGMNDSVLVRTGKEMGADDYLFKPISEQNLMAAIRGKIKRFRRLAAGNAAHATHSTFTDAPHRVFK